MLADFWTMHPGGTWPAVSAVFLVVVGTLLLSSYLKHREEVKAYHESLKKERLEEGKDYHYHQTPDGIWHKCYHACKNQNLFFSKMYWVSLTFAFPIEHIVYHKLWPFYLLSNWLNIS